MAERNGRPDSSSREDSPFSAANVRHGFSVMGVTRGLTIAYLAAVIGLPVAAVVVRGFYVDGAWTASVLVAFLSSDTTRMAVATTAAIALPSTLIAMAVGLTLAWLVARTDVPARALIAVGTMGLIVIPNVMVALGWELLLAPRNGILNVLSRFLLTGTTDGAGPFSAYTVAAIVVAIGTNLVPYVFALLYPALRNMDASLEEASLVAGATEAKTTLYVTLLAVRPAILAAGFLLFLLAASNFSFPFILGTQSGVHVLSTRLYETLSVYPSDYPMGSQYAICIGLFAAGLLYAHNRAIGRGSYALISGKGARRRTVSLGRTRHVAAVLALAYCLVALALPVFALVVVSLMPYWQSIAGDVEYGLNAYRYVLFESTWAMPALRNSLVLGAVGAIGCIALAYFVGWNYLRRPSRLSKALEQLANAPIGIPNVVMGAGALVALGMLLPQAIGSLVPMLLIYTVLSLPIALRGVTSALRQIGPQLEEAAAIGGASTFQTSARITIPLASSGILYSWILLFVLLIREFEASVFLVTPGVQVFASALIDMRAQARLPSAAAYSVIVLVVSLILLALARGASRSLRYRHDASLTEGVDA